MLKKSLAKLGSPESFYFSPVGPSYFVHDHDMPDMMDIEELFEHIESVDHVPILPGLGRPSESLSRILPKLDSKIIETVTAETREERTKLHESKEKAGSALPPDDSKGSVGQSCKHVLPPLVPVANSVVEILPELASTGNLSHDFPVPPRPLEDVPRFSTAEARTRIKEELHPKPKLCPRQSVGGLGSIRLAPMLFSNVPRASASVVPPPAEIADAPSTVGLPLLRPIESDCTHGAVVTNRPTTPGRS